MHSFRFFCRTLKVTAACLAIFAAGCNLTQRTVDKELKQGEAAYRNGQTDEEISHYQKAMELDPGNLHAKRLLADALARNVVPGQNTPENLKTAQRAIDLFQAVLEKDPHDVSMMKQIAGVYLSIKKWDESKAWQKKVLEEDPQDPETAYTIGVIDLTEANQNVEAALNPAGIKDDGMGNAKAPAAVMKKIKAQNGPLVEEAQRYLVYALNLRPNYEEALESMSQVYRRKADLDYGKEADRKQDVAVASEWMQKALTVRKAYEEKNAGTESAKP